MSHKHPVGTRHVVSSISPFAPLPLRAFALGFCLCILFLAFFLRFHNLGAQSFWNDEGSSYVQATRSFADIAANAARDIHPPGYYWLLSIWRQFVGDSEFALRSLSAFASVLTVAFTYALGKRLFNPAAGLAAALFVALNTFSIYYAQEARMYALLALWGIMGMWALSKVLSTEYKVQSNAKKPSLRCFLSTQNLVLSTLSFLALINAAGLYTQYAYPFVMLAQGAIFLVWLVGKLIGGRTRHASSLQILGLYVAANILTILLYLPWLPTALTQVTQWPSTGEVIPTGEAIRVIGEWTMWGITAHQSGIANSLLVGVPIILILLYSCLLLPLLAATVTGWWQSLLPFIYFVLPVTVFLVLGLFRTANLKFLLPSQIGFALFIGLMLSSIIEMISDDTYTSRRKIFASLAFITPFLLPFIETVPSLYADPAYRRPDYRTMVATITADPHPGDAIILDAPNQEEVFRYYYKNAAPVYPLPPGLGGNDAETAALTQDIINRHDRIFVLFWGEAERDPNHIVETALDSQTFQAGIDQWYGDVRFAVYVTPAEMPDLTPSAARFGDSITLDGYALSATTIQPNDVLQVRLDWQTDAPLTTPYKVFLQLLNNDGIVVTQRDAEPGGGSLSTTSWISGETVTDRHGLTIPADLPSGSYLLIVGLYNRDDPSAGLPVGTSDYLDLGSIQVNGT